MKNVKWLGASGVGVLLVLAAAGCKPAFHELGDEPVAGAGAEAGTGPTGSVIPNGGSTHSPSGGTGHSGNAGASVGGPPLFPDTPECFSPTQNVEGALKPGAVPCPCGPSDPPQCVGTRFLPDFEPLTQVSMECVDGAWAIVPEGLCDGGAACQTDDGIFPSGMVNVPDPFSCNTCECHDGKITSCTEIGCPKVCPENSQPALGCLDCVDGECHLAHYACFTSDYVDCHDGGCFATSVCADQLP